MRVETSCLTLTDYSLSRKTSINRRVVLLASFYPLWRVSSYGKIVGIIVVFASVLGVILSGGKFMALVPALEVIVIGGANVDISP